MAKLIIDGREIEVEDGLTVLEAAKRLDIEIPTLCYHQALGPYGACRVCLVEVVAHGRTRLVTACTYPAGDGIEVKTDSERVNRARRFSIELLLARCPNVQSIRNLARKLGVQRPRFKCADEDCILCGMCVRVCRDIIGQSALSFINRGKERKVQTPFEAASEDCIGCGACAFICPTGAITLEDIDKFRKVNYPHVELEMVQCKECSARFATAKELEYLKQRTDLPKETFEICPKCRRNKLKLKITSK